MIASWVARTTGSLWRASPVYYPDEYLYTALARSVAHTGLPMVRGAFVPFPAVLVPYLVAPAWLIGNVEVAYHVALASAGLWFSLAAIPTYALARRLGVHPGGGLIAALLAVLVPDGAFTTTLLTEPYAYFLFACAALLAVETIVSPTRLRQVLLLLVFGALLLTRTQFVFLPFSYLAAAWIWSGTSAREFVRGHAIVTSGVALSGLVVALLGPSRLAGAYGGLIHASYSPLQLGRWFVVDAFVLSIATGWVVVPGAVLGFRRMLVSGEANPRAFVLVSLTSLVCLLGEASAFGAREARAHERYCFYAAPLIAIAAVWSAQALRRGRTYSLVACAMAGLAIFLPALGSVERSATDESPTLLGLRLIGGGARWAELIWAVGLSLLALIVASRLGGPSAPLVGAVAILALVSGAGTVALLRFDTTLSPELATNLARSAGIGAPAGAELLVLASENRFRLMHTLFWNPTIGHVAVLGGGAAPDGYAARSVFQRSRVGLVDANGRPVATPLAVDDDATELAASGGSGRAFVRQQPAVVIFGLSHADHYLDAVSELSSSTAAQPALLTFRLVSLRGTKTMSFVCGGARALARVETRPTTVSIRLPARAVVQCRIGLVRGSAVEYDDRTVSVEVTHVVLTPLSAPSGANRLSRRRGVAVSVSRGATS